MMRNTEYEEVVVDISDAEEEQRHSLPSQSWLPDLNLNQEDKVILESKQWLTDKNILATQKLLSKQFPHIPGLQPPYLEQKNQFKHMPTSGVQIANENNQHWVCLSTLSSPPHTIDLYDSLKTKKISSHILKQCGLLLCSQKKGHNFSYYPGSTAMQSMVVIVGRSLLQMQQSCVLDLNQAMLYTSSHL